jgi:hypothetical protein
VAEAFPPATVANKPGHRGEHDISRKTIARGMPGETGVTVVTTLVCFFHLHARLRARRAPGIPCALVFSGANGSCKLGRIAPRDGGRVSQTANPARPLTIAQQTGILTDDSLFYDKYGVRDRPSAGLGSSIRR